MFQTEEVKISTIIIEDRARKELLNIPELMESLKKWGQLTPILVTEKYELMAGGRRIEAMKRLSWETCVARIMPNLSKADQMFIELIENKEREDFLWHEELELKHKMHNHWVKEAKANNSTWGYRDTAAKFHCALGGLSTDLTLAEAIESFPELKECDNKTQAKNTYKKLGEQAIAFQSLDKLPEEEKEKLNQLLQGKTPTLEKKKTETTQEIPTVSGQAIHDDEAPNFEDLTKQKVEVKPDLFSRGPKAVYVIKKAEDFIFDLPDNSVGLIELDPPYAINFEENYGNIGKRKAKETDWTKEDLYNFYQSQFPILYSKLLDSSWVILWIGVEHWLKANEIAKASGFKVQSKPGIWIKPGGECNRPSCEFIHNYEMFLLLRKGKATFNVPSFLATIEHNATPGSKKIHQWEKPITLYDHFLKALGRQGSLFLSPFAGSGNSMISAAKYGMVPMGCDTKQKYAINFYERFNNYFMEI